MTHFNNALHSMYTGQKGIVLITCLLLLFLLTMIVTSAFRTSYMQTFIANNFRFQAISFNNAESSLRTAEAALETHIRSGTLLNFSTAGDGYYNKDDALDVRNLDWDNLSANEDGNEEGDKFVVQYHGRYALPGADESATGNVGEKIGSHVYTFLITARSLSAKRAERVVQSVYVTLEQP